MNEEKLLRRITGYSFAVMLLTICLSFAVRYKEEYNIVSLERDATLQEELLYVEATPTMIPKVTVYPVETVMQNRHATEEVWEVWQLISQETMAALMEKVSDRCILIEKPKGMSQSWELTENLPHYQMTFTLRGAEENLHAASVLRRWEDVFYFGSPEENELLKEFSVLSYEEKEGAVTSEVTMTFDKCYVPQVIEQEEYYIIHLKKYSEVYDRIVVLDAGHGGKDPGAGAEGYRIEEADINLKLLLYLKELLEKNTDIKVFCTRTEDVYLTLQERADLALGMEADLFISWHCNSSESDKRNGTEMLYNAKQGVEEAFNSKTFAQLCLEKLVKALGTKNMGITDRQELHIVRRATMPVVLVETAYLSNEKDLAILKDESMLQVAANAIYEAVLIAYERMEE